MDFGPPAQVLMCAVQKGKRENNEDKTRPGSAESLFALIKLRRKNRPCAVIKLNPRAASPGFSLSKKKGKQEAEEGNSISA